MRLNTKMRTINIFNTLGFLCIMLAMSFGMTLVKRFINDSEAFRQEERDKITKKRVAMAKYVNRGALADGIPNTLSCPSQFGGGRWYYGMPAKVSVWMGHM